MSSAARDWLQRQAAGVPPSLHARMLQACDDVAADPGGAADPAGAGHDTAAAGREVLARSLARAAISCMREAVERCDERTAALPLLAADALITAACAAAAENGAGAVEEICARYAPDRLVDLLAAP